MIFIGDIFGVYILVIAAIETALALSIILSYYRLTSITYQLNKTLREDIFS